ncbi:glycosyltransferase family 4 protein [Corynebacterium striatum]
MSNFIFLVSDSVWGGKHEYMMGMARILKQEGHQVRLIGEIDGAFAAKAREEEFDILSVSFENEDGSNFSVLDPAWHHAFLVATGRRDLKAIYEWGMHNTPNVSIVFIRHSAFELDDTSEVQQVLDKALVAFATSEFQRNTQFTVPPLEKLSRKSHVLTSGVDIDSLSAVSFNEKAHSKTLLGIPSNSWVVGYAGRLSWEKELDDLLTEWHVVVQKVPNAHLLIGGDGPLREHLEKRVIQENLGTSVTFSGFRTNSSEILSAMDVAVLNSRVPETGPLFLKEAMAMGIPVLARNVGGIPEFVDSEVGAVIEANAELAPALIQQSEIDREELQSIGKRARQRICAGHKISDTATKFLSLCVQELGKSSEFNAWLKGCEFNPMLRYRRESSGGFIFVPNTSALYELGQVAFDEVCNSIKNDDPTMLIASKKADGVTLAQDLVAAGAITTTRE